ncbi:MAG TPA: hypothetical protein P5150_06685 [Candidatus Ratteibacteria bacterium]|nr:hypothetical protein [bacterium]HRR96399.1 hypothetical protein [Candidatus Ratteibacteria bacterium]
MDKKVIDEGKGLAWLSYLGLLLLIPLLVNKDNEYSKFHVKQGLVLLICGIITRILWIIPVIGWVVGMVVGIFLLVLMIIGIVNALSEKTEPLPVIGKYAEKIKI